MSIFHSKLKMFLNLNYSLNIIVVASLVCQAMFNSSYQPLDDPITLKMGK